jgi:hypothetical protein
VAFLRRAFVIKKIQLAIGFIDEDKPQIAKRLLISTLKKLESNGRKGRKHYKPDVDKRPNPPATIYES